MTGWLALAINTAGLVLLGFKFRIGWIFGIAAECLWIVRADQKDMPELICMSVIYIGLATINWNKWRKDESNDSRPR